MPTPAYCKVCELEDFAAPSLRRVMRGIFDAQAAGLAPDWPTGFETRKHWEIAMTVRSLADFGALRPDSEVLGVGAGTEPTSFWLTTRVGRVFATDLYLEPGIWSASAATSMLADPGRHWTGRWNPRRLVVQHMNALDLLYEDGSFDAVFSSSSVEHFGTADDVRRAALEIYRVLRPGGVASISTEFRLAGRDRMPGTLVFGPTELHRCLIAGVGWNLAAPLELSVSPATLETELDWADVLADIEAGRTRYPHIVLRRGDLRWTSVHLALHKPG